MSEGFFAILFCIGVGAGLLFAARRSARSKIQGVIYLPWQATASVLVILGIQWVFGAMFYATLDPHDSNIDRALGKLLFNLLFLAPFVTVIGAGIVWRLFGKHTSDSSD
jgi:hypothetical protein